MTDGSPTPGIFDGMAAYRGRGNSTILIRNHENRSRDGRGRGGRAGGQALRPRRRTCAAATPSSSSAATAGVRRASPCSAARTPTAPAARRRGARGSPARRSSTTAPSRTTSTPGTGVPHGYSFEVPADATGPVARSRSSTPGRFSHEAVAWLDGVLYETEDRGNAALLPLPARAPAARVRRPGQLRRHAPGTRRQRPPELRRQRRPTPARRYARRVGDDRGAQPARRTRCGRRRRRRAPRSSTARRASGRPTGACTSTARLGRRGALGQIWELTPRGHDGGELTLVYESASADDLQNPDNLVVVPAHRRRLPAGGRRRRAVRARRDAAGARSTTSRRRSSPTRSSAAAASAPTATDVLPQPAGRPAGGRARRRDAQPDEKRGLTYAIWGPFRR